MDEQVELSDLREHLLDVRMIQNRIRTKIQYAGANHANVMHFLENRRLLHFHSFVPTSLYIDSELKLEYPRRDCHQKIALEIFYYRYVKGDLPKFPELPTELRVKIWRQSLARRILHISAYHPLPVLSA